LLLALYEAESPFDQAEVYHHISCKAAMVCPSQTAVTNSSAISFAMMAASCSCHRAAEVTDAALLLRKPAIPNMRLPAFSDFLALVARLLPLY
jgi:hypothetical protein